MKYLSLHSFRGIAALFVALHHGYFASINTDSNVLIEQAFLFVDFFFVLSGFIMAFAYRDKIINGLSFSRFAILRFGRLYPLHFVTLMAWVIWGAIKYIAAFVLDVDYVENRNTLWNFLTNLTLTHSLGMHTSTSWNTPSWSISVEFFTYIIFFVYIFLIGKFYRPVFSLLLSIACFFYLYFSNEYSVLVSLQGGIFRCLGGFALGMFVQDMHKKYKGQYSSLIYSVVEILILALVVSFFYMQSSKFKEILIIYTFGLVIYIFAIQEKGVISQLLKTRVFIFLGTISYSLYLCHFLISVIFRTVFIYIFDFPFDDSKQLIFTEYALLINSLYIGVSLICSYYLFKYVETPGRDYFRRIADVQSMPKNRMM